MCRPLGSAALLMVAGTAYVCAAEVVLVDQLDYLKDVRPLIANYCGDCHTDGAKKGGVDLDLDGDARAIAANKKLWGGVKFHVEQWTMPPHDRKSQPTQAERDLITQWLDHTLYPVDVSRPDPGRVTTRRLNRAEYNHTVRDLLGVNLRPADEFPADDSGYGFDTIGDVLTLPPILMERYLIAADRVLAAAVPDDPPAAREDNFAAGELKGDGFPQEQEKLLAFEGSVHVQHHAAADGDYVVRFYLREDAAGKERAKARLAVGEATREVEVKVSSQGEYELHELRARLLKGENKISAAFLNDYYNPDDPNEGQRDRNLGVQRIVVDGPHNSQGPAATAEASRYLTMGEGGDADGWERARQGLAAFMRRAWRRPVKGAEVERVMRIFSQAQRAGESWRHSVRTAMKLVLVSPHFLFRLEGQPNPNDDQEVVELGEVELASRLSYWLWSSLPDEELLSLAERGQLRAQLAAQVSRMLKDGKAGALAENFGGQWLQLRSLSGAAPDRDLFPAFGPEVRAAMLEETEQMFKYIIIDNRDIMDFISGDYTFLNQKLAEWYGMEGVVGQEFRKVMVGAGHRRKGGVLTHGSVLTLTSDTTRTSPVKRGKWVLETILGVAPPPPPPNVPPLQEAGHGKKETATVRERLEQHRSKPGCVSCHSLIDPLGFGLEHYDAVGRWRDADAERPVDSKGVLTTGQEFASPEGLAEIISSSKQTVYLRNIVQKMLTYALGRGVEPYDRPAVEGILRTLEGEGNRFHSLVLGIAQSVPFQKRRGDKRR